MKSLYYKLASENAIVVTTVIFAVAWCCHIVGMVTVLVALLLSCPMFFCDAIAISLSRTWIDPDVFFVDGEYQLRCNDGK